MESKSVSEDCSDAYSVESEDAGNQHQHLGPFIYYVITDRVRPGGGDLLLMIKLHFLTTFRGD